MQEIGVIGSGLMGAGIAQVAAQSGLKVLLTDQRVEALDGAKASLEKSLQRFKERGRLDEDVSVGMSRIETTGEMEDFSRLGFVIEAISEQESQLF